MKNREKRQNHIHAQSIQCDNPLSTKRFKKFYNCFLIQLLCQIMFWTQLTLPQTAYAADTTTTSTDVQSLDQINQLNQANTETQSQVGTVTTCSSERTAYDSYTQLQSEYTDYSANLSNDISTFVSNANDELGNLLTEQSAFYESDLGFVNPTTGIETDYEAIRDRWRAAQAGLVSARDATTLAQRELSAAQSACDGDHEYCSRDEQRRISAAAGNLGTARTNLSAAEREYNSARSAYRGIPRNMEADSQEAVNSTSDNANEMNDSHSISGCGSNFDITTNTDEECTLTGPLFERDTAITEIVNRNVAQARELANQRERALFELEMQQTYDADYKMYKLAVDNVTGSADDQQGKNELSAALEISNMKTMSLASASIRNMVCEKHDISESDPQSYYLFRAAMATWLTAVVNDTDYYSEESNCMAVENITTDENNEQVQTIERAANLSERQLKSLCLRSRPSVDDLVDTSDSYFLDNSNPDGWMKYRMTPTSTKNETVTYVNELNNIIRGYTDPDTNVIYPPLETRCDNYLQEIIGDDYDPTQARTREYAVEMIQEALGVAVQELGAKREKLAIAYANVQKGEQWVSRVQRDIMIMTALAAVVAAAQRIAASMCGPHNPGACAIAAALKSKWLYITGIVLGVWLFTELMRAQSFLAKWRQKLEDYKFFSHMACNFEDAHEEKDAIEALGRVYNDRRKEVMQNATNGVINEVNHILYEEISGNSVNGSTTQMKQTIKKINEKIVHVKTVPELERALSEIFFKTKNRVDDVKTLLSSLGVSILIHALPGDEAFAVTTDDIDQAEIYNTTNSLNIQTGTGNFTYFLTQRNQQFQNLTHDITIQPRHTSGTTEISNSGTKSVSGLEILSVHDLAAPFIGGDGHDPLNDIQASQYPHATLTDNEKLALMKTGFATPETRVVTLQNALALMLDNLTQLEFSTAVAGYNLDQYVSLLDTTRRELEIEEEGLGSVDAEQVVSPTNACLAETGNESLAVDPMCTCREASNCASFQFPTFNVEVPEALRNSGDSAIKTANNIVAGDLKGANVSGGTLMNNAANVRKIIDDTIDRNNKNTSGTNNANSLNQASESAISGTLSTLGNNPNSTFNKLRKSLANNGLSGGNQNKSTNSDQNNKEQNKSNPQTNKYTNAAVSGTRSNTKGTGEVSSSNATISESFNLGGGNSNLNLAELSDEEKRRLGLLNDVLKNDEVVAIRNGFGGHQRKVSTDQNNKKTGHDGIHTNRNASLFSIISNRYEKTAFPILLKVKKVVK